ncbi:hypothetical protein [Streptomyces sp. NPDC001930]
MTKFTTTWRDEEWRRKTAKTATKWAAWQAVKEVLRLVLELWLQT